MQTDIIFALLLAAYAATALFTGIAFFRWDIGSIHIRFTPRVFCACLAPTVLSLIAGFTAGTFGRAVISHIIEQQPSAIRALIVTAIVLAFGAYTASDDLMQRLLKPGFLRYHDQRARLPR